MAKCVLIVQGEGRGHLSQSMALSEFLEEAGHRVEVVYAGIGIEGSLPGYFNDFFRDRVREFHSPYFLRKPNKKGIDVGKSLRFNLLRFTRYLVEVKRIRQEINGMEPDVVFNLYDIVGALAIRKVKGGIRRIGIGHHFYLHLDGYRCRGGSVWHRWLLSTHTKLIMKSCDRVLALSFREVEGKRGIRVVPPLVRRAFRELHYKPGKRFLVYLLNEGYIFDLVRISQEDPGFNADVFTARALHTDLPPGITIHPLSDEAFREKMTSCRGLITTAGFDTVAEAAYHGIPLLVIPSQHHFEQRCNAKDVEQTGIGIPVEQLRPGIHLEMKPYENVGYLRWVDRAGAMIINSMTE